MKNALELYRLGKKYRKGKELSYAEVARRARLDRSTVTRNCKNEQPIGDSAALKYTARLKIPIQDLRPDLYEKDQAPP